MSKSPRLIGDIGGTHVRLALVSADDDVIGRATIKGNEYPTLALAILAGLEQFQGNNAPDEAALAVAGPVTGAHFKLTNRPAWSIDVDALRQSLDLKRITLINDFTALALAVPRLGEADTRPLGAPGLIALDDAPIALLGPGTGLGVSGLMRCGDDWQPIAGEGGHVLLAAGSEREAEVLATIRRSGVRASGDRLLSGPGLRTIYMAIAGLDPGEVPDAAAIAAANNSFARETLALFAWWLGGFAGDLALTFGARGGVYVGGGVVPKLGDAFPVERFRAGFEAKGRLAGYVADIPTRLITRPDAGVLGASAALGRVGPGIVTASGDTKN